MPMRYRAIFSAERGRGPALAAGLLLALVPLLPAGAAPGNVVTGMQQHQPREFGYQLGDKFEREVRMVVRAPFELVESSLPQTGRLNRWLSFDAATVNRSRHGDGTQYHIVLGYQVHNVDPDRPAIDVPGHILNLSDGSRTLNVAIRPSMTRVSRLTDPAGPGLQADDPPPPREYRRARLLAPAALLAVAVTGLLAIGLRLPLASRRKAFARALVRLRRLPAGPWDASSTAEALRVLHAAFNKTAGRTLFASDIPEFCRQHPAFQPLAGRITAFFTFSRDFFFGAGGATPGEQSSRAGLIALAAACSDAERGLR